MMSRSSNSRKASDHDGSKSPRDFLRSVMMKHMNMNEVTCNPIELTSKSTLTTSSSPAKDKCRASVLKVIKTTTGAASAVSAPSNKSHVALNNEREDDDEDSNNEPLNCTRCCSSKKSTEEKAAMRDEEYSAEDEIMIRVEDEEDEDIDQLPSRHLQVELIPSTSGGVQSGSKIQHHGHYHMTTSSHIIHHHTPRFTICSSASCPNINSSGGGGGGERSSSGPNSSSNSGSIPSVLSIGGSRRLYKKSDFGVIRGTSSSILSSIDKTRPSSSGSGGGNIGRNSNNSSSGQGNSNSQFKFVCFLCGHEYPRESTLKNHLKVYHKIDTPDVVSGSKSRK